MNTLSKQFSILALVCFFFSGTTLNALEEQLQEDECSQEILLSYFPEVFVKETLTKNNIPREKWDAINRDLASRDKEIIKIVESKAAKMNPNPLKDPQQRQMAVKLFRDTLVENFSAVMKSNGINDDKQIQVMLEDIQQQKAKRFARCMQQVRPAQQPSKAENKSKANTEENDDDDHNDHDDDDNEKDKDEKDNDD